MVRGFPSGFINCLVAVRRAIFLRSETPAHLILQRQSGKNGRCMGVSHGDHGHGGHQILSRLEVVGI